ncbi:TRAP transporter substrate-binding protein [Mesorhizobium sp. ASY16-5R]|uniref:TRAP transporter substrate-binding protein n=1 Tax=Mesorhizobium sp. ASY16-5R TaxID=3445772 RepID=UPI003FA1957B
MRSIIATLAFAASVLAPTTFAVSQELPRTQLKIVGLQSHLNSFKSGEKPFWEETIPKASNGAVTGDITAQDLNGLKGPEILRLMKLGVIDFASGVIGYMAGDSAEFDGVDLAGVSPNMDTTRKVVDAYMPVLQEVMEKQYGARLLMLFPSPPQVMWCAKPVKSTADLKGLKVRVFTASMADLIGGLGATTVTLPFAEVTTSLERGVIDCAVTGTLSGNTNKMFEVTNTMYTLYSGWSVHFTAVSLETWNKLDPKVQAFLTEQYAGFRDRLWATVAEEEQDGINCSVGRGDCKMGIAAKMTLAEPSAEDLAAAKAVVESTVVPNWATRCGEACADRWLETVGKVVGIEKIAAK